MTRPYFKQKVPTTIGAMVSGSLYYRKHPTAIPEVPAYRKAEDKRAWAMGWNREAEKAGDPARLEIPVVKAPSKRKKTPKDQLEASVIREAATVAKRRGWELHRRNTGAVFTPNGGMIRYGEKGAADTYLIIDGRHIEAEAKRRDGRGRLSEAQKAFRSRCEEQGIPYIVYTSGDGFEKKIDKILLDFKENVE
jgi:hypothetical protein